MKFAKGLALTALALGFTACGDGIPMLGMGENNKALQAAMSHKDYAQNLATMINTLDENTERALQTRQSVGKWSVHTVIVGVGFVAEAGFGPLKVTAEPRFRFIFADSDKPVIP
jgi:hypothetical protein